LDEIMLDIAVRGASQVNARGVPHGLMNAGHNATDFTEADRKQARRKAVDHAQACQKRMPSDIMLEHVIKEDLRRPEPTRRRN
jgi:hypothetical protein